MPPKRRTPQEELFEVRLKLQVEAKRLFGLVKYMGGKHPDWKGEEGLPNPGGDIILVSIKYLYTLVYRDFLSFIINWLDVRDKASKRHYLLSEIAILEKEYSLQDHEDEGRFLIAEMERVGRQFIHVGSTEMKDWLLELEDKEAEFREERRLFGLEKFFKNVQNFLFYQEAAREDILNGEKEDRYNLKKAYTSLA